MKFKWHLLTAALLIVLGLVIWAQVLHGSVSANTGLPINSSTKIHIAVDITGWGAIVGSVALPAGTGLMLAAIARAFLRPRITGNSPVLLPFFIFL
jgi:hypothetical protein